MRVVVLIKQVPKAQSLALDDSGRLHRDGVALEINAYCRRAVSKGVELVREYGGECVVVSLGPPSAEDALREAVAWGVDRAVLVTDPAFAGSDTLATARALAAAISRLGECDLVLTGRNSVDADTGQVGPALAELLGLPFVGGVRRLAVVDAAVRAECEHDDGWSRCQVDLPAVLSCAERLCDPAKVSPEDWSAVPGEAVERWAATDLGRGPWGQAGSPTRVGEVRVQEIDRACLTLSGPVDEQVEHAVEVLAARGALGNDPSIARPVPQLPITNGQANPAVVVIGAPDREQVTRELLGAAALLAAEIGGGVVVIDVGASDGDPDRWGSWGADEVVRAAGSQLEQDVAATVASWCHQREPWAVLLPGTMWGREVGARVAARLAAGLTGDAVELSVDDNRLVCWKPAFGGRLIAAIRADSPVQLVTVRPGALPLPEPRPAPQLLPVTAVTVPERGRLLVSERGRDDDIEVLSNANVLIGVGMGLAPADYPALEPLRSALGAELAATRKVTDRGWLPRDRQVGLTGRSVAPRLYLAIGTSGKFNHMVGVRRAATVLAINSDPDAFVFEHADVGIVADWREAVPSLLAGVSSVTVRAARQR